MKIEIDNNICQLVVGGPDYAVDPNIASEVRSYLSVDVPGAWHSAQFRKHQWDGKKYYCTPKLKVPTGMLPILLDMLEDDYPDLPVELVDNRTGRVEFRDDWDTQVLDNNMEGDYAYQLQLAQAFSNHITFRDQELYFPRGIIDAATNAGKTTIIAGLYNNAIGDNKMLILIHKKSIFRELMDFMGQVFGEVGVINDKYYEIRPVTVAMVQTLANRVSDGVRVRQDLQQFNILVADESHHCGSKQYAKVLKYCDAFCRVFVSGTALDSGDIISKLNQISMSGKKLREVKKRELMDKGISVQVEVRVHICNTKLYEPILDYRTAQEQCIHFSYERSQIISGIVNQSTGPVLIAVDKIQHGDYLFRHMKIEKTLGFTHGEDPNQLEEVEKFKRGEYYALIATGILSEGVNMPHIRELVYAVGGKSKILIKQWMGRAERQDKGKRKAVFHDFYDVGAYVKKHSETRLRIYHDEELPILNNFDLKEARKLKPVLVQ